jgi:hypothetical protein
MRVIRNIRPVDEKIGRSFRLARAAAAVVAGALSYRTIT